MNLSVAMLAGLCFLHPNVASAATRVLKASLNGAQQVPPTTSLGTGQATATLDDITGNVSITGSFSNLGSNAAVAHIHNGANDVIVPMSATFATSGTMSGSRQVSAADIADLLAGRAYVNLHTVNFNNGEIRGALTLAPAVPATPAVGLTLLALGLGAVGAWKLAAARRRASRA